MHPFGPIDLGMHGREQQRQELREEALQGLLPGAIIVALGRRGLGAVMVGWDGLSVADSAHGSGSSRKPWSVRMP